MSLEMIDKLERYRNEKVSAERKFWKAPLDQLSMPMTVAQFDVLLAELRAARKVVDRARIRMNIHGKSNVRLIYEIDQAVEEYDREFAHSGD